MNVTDYPPLPEPQGTVWEYDQYGHGGLQPSGHFTAEQMREYVDADREIRAGYVLAPLEPTIGMCIAGDEARANADDMTRTPAVYRAMIAARPNPSPTTYTKEK